MITDGKVGIVEEQLLDKRQYSEKEAESAFVKSLIELKADSQKLADSYIIAAALNRAYDTVVDVRKDSSRVLIWDNEQGIYVDLETDIDIKFCSLASAILSSNKSIESLSRETITHIKSLKIITGDNAAVYNEPPRHFVQLADGVLDVKADKYVDEKIANQYHFTSKLDLKREQTVDPLFAEIFTRILKHDWSQDDEKLYQMRLDILRCVIEGDSKGVSFFNHGSGGNGKSTFNNMAAALVSEEYVDRINIHEFDRSFNLAGLSSSTRLILGDELVTSFRLSGQTLAIFKQLVDRQALKVEEKFKSPATIKPNCVLLQNTNTIPQWSESNNAVKARVVYVPWPDKDFRQGGKSEFFAEMSLDDMLETQDFRAALFNFVMNNTSYFEKFPVPKEIKQESDKQIDSSDNVKQFVEYLIDMDSVGYDAVMPLSTSFEQYIHFLKSENPSAKPMSRRMFSLRFIDIMREHGYHIKKSDEGRSQASNIRPLSYLEWDRSIIGASTSHHDLEAMLDVNPSAYKTHTLVNEELMITDAEVDEVRALIDADAQLDVDDYKIRRILLHLIYDEKNLEIASKYSEQLKY